MKKTFDLEKLEIFVATFFIVILSDQFTKYWIQNILPLNSSIKLASFFSLSHTINYGAGFSILQGWRWFLIVFTIAVIWYVLYECKNIKDNLVAFYAALILGGATGKLYTLILLHKQHGCLAMRGSL